MMSVEFDEAKEPIKMKTRTATATRVTRSAVMVIDETGMLHGFLKRKHDCLYDAEEGSELLLKLHGTWIPVEVKGVACEN